MGGFKRLLEARQTVLAHLSWQHLELDGSSCVVVSPCLSVGTGRKSSSAVLGMEVWAHSWVQHWGPGGCTRAPLEQHGMGSWALPFIRDFPE